MKVYLVSRAVYLGDNIPEVTVEKVFSSREEAEKYKLTLEKESHLWSDTPTFHIAEHEVDETAPSSTQWNNVRVVVRKRCWDNGFMRPFVCGTNEEPCNMCRDKEGVWRGVFKNDPDMPWEEFEKFVLGQCKEEK